MDGMNVCVRFTESERYDIERDIRVTRFSAISDHGTWTVESKIESASDKRKKRAAFRNYVLQSIAMREMPMEFYEEDLEQLVREVELQ